MGRITQLITSLFRRQAKSDPPHPQARDEWNLNGRQPVEWPITCPHCKANSHLVSGPIDPRLTCKACGESFEPFPDALTLRVSREASWATEATLLNLYEASVSLRGESTLDWKPSAPINQPCPNCQAPLRGTVQLYRLNRCPACQGIFLPVLENVAVRSNNTLERFGRFPVLETLGHGGMGIVYKAHHPERKCPFALKIILNHNDWSSISRFYREGETVARLRHPHIVKIHEVGQYDGVPYLALEYLAGGSLRDRLKQGKLSIQETISLAETLARTLDYAHERGVIHRDLKPANVLLAEDGTPKISDFGLVKRVTGDMELGDHTISIPAWHGFLRRIVMKSLDPKASLSIPHPDALCDVGLVLGTPAYMAPEQWQGDSDQVGPAADIFAFGVMIYEMLTGRLPFPAGTVQDASTKEPLPPSTWNIQVPKKLDEIVLKCLRKRPEKRFHSAKSLAEALASVEHCRS